MTEYVGRPLHECPSLVALLRRRASEDREKVAFTWLADGETEKGTVTYGELDRQARAIAATLQAQGLAGERALLLYPPGLDYVAAFFGCLYAGVVAVPAFPPRRNRSLDRLQAIAADARVAVVLATPAVRAMVDRPDDSISGLHAIPWLLSDGFSADAAASWRNPGCSGESLAFLQYTSGSTAVPKGVMVTHDNLLHNCHWIRRRFGHTAESRGVIWLPPYHDMGLIGGILQPLYVGFPCYLMSPVSVFSSPFAWLQAISRYRATTSGGPNFAYELCLRKINPEQRATLDLGSWQVAFSGAEPVRSETLERFAEHFAPCGFRREAFYPCYGLAEGTLLVSGGTINRPPRTLGVRKAALEANQVVAAPAGDADRRVLVGCGEGLVDQRVLTVHPEALTRCSPGEVGEVWVAGPSVAQGYWDQPEESRRTFQARVADTGEGPFLRTGDLGFLHEGELFITGRLKDLIIFHGRNVYPHDLERTAERGHSDLQPGAGAAFSVEGNGQEQLVIVHEVIPRRRPDIGVVAEAVRRAVAEEHEVDLHVFVLLRPGGIPKTSSGKIRRRACRREFLAGTLDAFGEWHATDRPAGGALSRSAILALPPRERQGRLETHFRDELARILRLEPSAVDMDQPVNRLGLDSLTTLELKNALEGNLGVTLPVSSFLQGASIAQLAAQVLQQLSIPPFALDLESMTTLLQQLQQLSDAQVKSLLARDIMSTEGRLP